MPDLLDVDQPDLDALFRLREYLQERQDEIDPTLKAFYLPGTGGFVHQLEPPRDTGPTMSHEVWSKASSATCIALLDATGRLNEPPWGPEGPNLAQRIVDSDWDSAKIGADNSFAVSFLLEALHCLGGPQLLNAEQRPTVNEKLAILVREVSNGPEPGGVALQEYEATSFLTYKAVVALKRWERLDEVRDAVATWNWNHLNKECVLVASDSQDADVFEVGYSALIANVVARPDEMTPQQRSLLRFAIGKFFAAQRADGSWPRSRPLFVYQALGHAYCYDYELLAALLSDRQLRRLASEHLGRLRKAAHLLAERRYPLLGARLADASGKTVYGWSSGHHGTKAAAESWATAAALHFCFALGRLVAESIRDATFEYVGADNRRPTEPTIAAPPRLPIEFLDSIVVAGNPTHLKTALDQRLLAPLFEAREDLLHGKPLRKKTTGNLRVPTSAILFGPPGTSKTELARLIAAALGWPLLALDPSHLTRHGLDAVHSEANKLFGMLQRCEQMVVLLDEFDELVRERDTKSQMASRFLTTAMLPKLTALSDERRIVYLVATNHLEQFDAAIRRPGRFDLIVPVMPPTAQEKLRAWPVLASALERLDTSTNARLVTGLEDLTFLEAKELAEETLPGVDDASAIIAAVDRAISGCTMRQPFQGESGDSSPSEPESGDSSTSERESGDTDAPETWSRRMTVLASKVRGLGVVVPPDGGS